MKTELYNTKINKYIRRELRKQDIGCERIMWNKLRNSQLGYKFRRQYGVGNYIVDFYCTELRLVIEIDGATHGTDEEIIYDKFRQKYLEYLGLSVVRYMNVDVYGNLEGVLADIQEMCNMKGRCV